MRSTAKTYKIPNALLEGVEQRVEENNFPSLNAYLVALIRRDLFFRDPLAAAALISSLPLELQDVVDDFVASVEPSAARSRTAAMALQSLFTHLITRSSMDPKLQEVLEESIKQLGEISQIDGAVEG